MENKIPITTIIVVLFVLLGLSGCALLSNSPVSEIPPSRLFCNTNPNMVDGKLETVGTFRSNGKIRKVFFEQNSAVYNVNPKKYKVILDGSLKSNTLIKLNKLTYIAYIEIHAGSDIPKLAIDFSAEEKSPTWRNSFVEVREKRHSNIKNYQVVRFDIRQKVLYLRLTAEGIEDFRNKQRVDRKEHDYVYEVNTPLKGAKIREVKFFERM